LKQAARNTAAGDAAAAATAAALAASDARDAVRLQPAFTKGYFRLGSALLHCGQPTEAVEALESGLARAPHNDELRAALRDAREAQEKARREALKEAKRGVQGQSAAQPTAPVAPPSKPKERTVDYAAAAQAAARANALSQQKAHAEPPPPPAAGKVDVRVTGAAADDGGPPLPETVQQFEVTWRRLGGGGGEAVAARRAWLSRLPTASYAALFKESLDEATLISVLECARTSAAGEAVGSSAAATAAAFGQQVLEGLASTRRFSLLLMFLDSKQKAVVKGVFKELERLGEPAPAQLRRLWEQ